MFRSFWVLCMAAMFACAALAQGQNQPNIPPPGNVPTAPPVAQPGPPAQPAAQPPAVQPQRPGTTGPTAVGTTNPTDTGIAQTTATGTGTGTNTVGQPGGTIITSGNVTNGTSGNPPKAQKPDLADCAPALNRMLGVMLFELLLEFGFTILRFLVNIGTFRGDTILFKLTIGRCAYLIFVFALNVGVLWFGSGSKASCLGAHNLVRVAFAILIFYALYVGMVVLLLVLEMKYDDDDSYGSYVSDEYDLRRRRRHQRGGHTHSDMSGHQSYDGHDGSKFLRFFGMGR